MTNKNAAVALPEDEQARVSKLLETCVCMIHDARLIYEKRQAKTHYRIAFKQDFDSLACDVVDTLAEMTMCTGHDVMGFHNEGLLPWDARDEEGDIEEDEE